MRDGIPVFPAGLDRAARALRALALAAGLLTASRAAAAQQVPLAVNFQGRLTDSAGGLVSGTRSLGFKIFASSAGGAPLWSETQASVAVSSGLFSAILGSANPLSPSLFSGPNAWLEVSVGTSTLAPRKRLALPSPYTHDAAALLGKDGSLFLYRDASSGNAGLGTSSPAAPLHVNSLSAPAVILQDGGSSDEVLRLSGGGAWLTLKPNAISSTLALHIGAGQNTYLRSDLGGAVGIGTTSPAQTLDVSGNVNALGYCVGAGPCMPFSNCSWVAYSGGNLVCPGGAAMTAWLGGSAGSSNVPTAATYDGTTGSNGDPGSQWQSSCSGGTCSSIPASGSMLCCR